MSFGAGNSQDMVNRMKQNRSQLASRKTKFKYRNRKITKKIYNAALNDKKLESVDNDLVLENIKKDLASKKKKEIVLFILIALCIGALIFIFVNNPFRFVYR